LEAAAAAAGAAEKGERLGEGKDIPEALELQKGFSLWRRTRFSRAEPRPVSAEIIVAVANCPLVVILRRRRSIRFCLLPFLVFFALALFRGNHRTRLDKPAVKTTPTNEQVVPQSDLTAFAGIIWRKVI
jgi:hypothetical protein